MSSKESSHWQFHLDQIEQEGISTKAYAAREGLNLQSLYQWRHALKQKRAGGGDPLSLVLTPRVPPRQFVQVSASSVGAVSAQTLRCCLVLPSGVRLEMSDMPSARWVTELAHELGLVGQRLR